MVCQSSRYGGFGIGFVGRVHLKVWPHVFAPAACGSNRLHAVIGTAKHARPRHQDVSRVTDLPLAKQNEGQARAIKGPAAINPHQTAQVSDIPGFTNSWGAAITNLTLVCPCPAGHADRTRVAWSWSGYPESTVVDGIRIGRNTAVLECQDDSLWRP
jgi:hypothetical protein